MRVIEGEFAYTRRRLEGNKDAKEDLEFIEELKDENLSLKQRLTESSKQLRQVFCFDPSLNHPSHQPKIPGRTQKVLVKSPAKPMQVKTQQEHLRLIDLLKSQLRKAESEISSLHTQLYSKGSGGGGHGLRNESGVNQSKDKNVRIDKLESRFENLDSAYKAQERELERTRRDLLNTQDQARQDTSKVLQLESQLRAAELAARSANELQDQLDEVKRERDRIERSLNELATNPFYQDVASNITDPTRLKVEPPHLVDLI